MFFFSKHKNNQRQVKHNLEYDKLAQSWVNRCLRVQDKASIYLQHKSEKLSLSSKRLVLIGFCFISFSVCIYIVIKSSFGDNRVRLSIATIRFSEQAAQNENEHIAAAKGVSKNEFERIKKFKAYIDSLSTKTSGRRIYDSIRKYRSGLIDSLAIIENIYQSQSTNK